MQPATWQQQLAQSYSSVADLSTAGLLTHAQAERLQKHRYQVRVTPYYATLIDPNDPNCPIRKQALPGLQTEEDPPLPSWAREWSQKLYGRPEPWSADPIGDLDKLAAPRLTHRYSNRAILHISTLCAVYCRFCFRKEHLNEREEKLYDGNLEPALAYLSNHKEIRELILTGGDPLSLTDAALARLLTQLTERAPHLKVVRLHSRMAVTLPQRLTPELASLLGAAENVHLVSHFNHPRELTPAAQEALTRMRRAGVPLYNQNVLLAGINDSTETLAELYQHLYELGVTPMYLHHADWTPGTFGFRVSIERGQRILRELAGRLPGAAIPHYVLDLPGGQGKARLMDATTRLVEQMPVHAELSGAVYELASPETRDGRATPLYLDLSRTRLQ